MRTREIYQNEEQAARVNRVCSRIEAREMLARIQNPVIHNEVRRRRSNVCSAGLRPAHFAAPRAALQRMTVADLLRRV